MLKCHLCSNTLGFPGGSAGKESDCNAGNPASIPGLGRSPGEGIHYPLQYSCLENPPGPRSLVGYSPWGRKESDRTEWLSTAQFTFSEHSSPFLSLNSLPASNKLLCPLLFYSLSIVIKNMQHIILPFYLVYCLSLLEYKFHEGRNLPLLCLLLYHHCPEHSCTYRYAVRASL